MVEIDNLLAKMRANDVTLSNYNYIVEENTQCEKQQWNYGLFSLYIFNFNGDVLAMKNDFDSKSDAKRYIKGIKLQKLSVQKG